MGREATKIRKYSTISARITGLVAITCACLMASVGVEIMQRRDLVAEISFTVDDVLPLLGAIRAVAQEHHRRQTTFEKAIRLAGAVQDDDPSLVPYYGEHELLAESHRIMEAQLLTAIATAISWRDHAHDHGDSGRAFDVHGPLLVIRSLERRYTRAVNAVLHALATGEHEDATEAWMDAEEASHLLDESLQNLLLSVDALTLHASRHMTETLEESEGRLIATTLAILLLGVLAAWVITRSITGPLRAAATVANEIAAGNLQPRITIATRDEVGLLLKALDNMARELKKNQWALQTTVEDLENEKAERQRVETSLRLAQKLEAVGQLAAGIAHEINTPNQFVQDNLSFLDNGFRIVLDALQNVRSLSTQSAIEPQEIRTIVDSAHVQYAATEIPTAIGQSIAGINRVSTIVRALKEFSHPGSLAPEEFDLNRGIETTGTISRSEWHRCATLDLALDAELPKIQAIPHEINQAVLNLIVNAAHAIDRKRKDSDGALGVIRISTENLGEDVELRISDSGTGISECDRARIFDPFYTTKEVGKGSGQGLAIVHSIVVDKHKGAVAFDTEVGRGTTFIIRLPIHAAAENPHAS